MSYSIISELKDGKTLITELKTPNNIMVSEENIILRNYEGIVAVFPKSSIVYYNEEDK